MINNVTLTANGNRYEKSNTAKKVGLGVGAAAGAGISVIGACTGQKAHECVANGLIGGVGLGLIGLAAGWIIDRFLINTERRRQADGEANAKLNANV